MRTVYLLIHGYCHEGEFVSDVYLLREDAEREARLRAAELASGMDKFGYSTREEGPKPESSVTLTVTILDDDGDATDYWQVLPKEVKEA